MEKTVPLAVNVDDVRSVQQLVRRRVQMSPERVSFRVLRDRAYHDVTAAQFLDDITRTAKAVIAAGIQPGEHVAITSATRYEWTVIDFAVLFAGGVVVPIYETSSVEQAAFILSDADVKLAFGETGRHVKLLGDALAANGRQAPVWRIIDGNENTFEQFRALGADVTDEQLAEREALATPQTIASLVYTSGTMSDPRGAEITHANLAHLAVNAVDALPQILHDEASTVLMLPLAHILARFVQLAAFWGGTAITHVRDASRVVATLSEAKPTFMVVVPRVMAKVLAGVRKTAEGKKMGKVFDQAEKVAIEWAQHIQKLDAGQDDKASLALKAQYKVFDKLFYSRIRETLGGRLQFMVSGAAPLDKHLGEFFHGAGIQVLEGYGLTETTAPFTLNFPNHALLGSVGTPLPGSTARISNDGEIEVKGLGVFAGYHNYDGREFTEDGFFPTGDLGRLDADGRLFITGRAKDMIITDSGKNISPQRWQGVVERGGLVANAVVVGDKRPHPVALLVLDLAAVKEWAKTNNRADLENKWQVAPPVPGERVTDEQLLAAVQTIVNDANKGGNHAERIDDYAVIVADVSEDAGYTTATMKLKRPKFIEAMAPVIEELYAKGRK
ncbi:AMP-dependent synthetase/ligase [Propionibacteriaceae bacterium G1746]|uniref:AMP-dependent synthetase/ligase n=1 Tax=Aestuariimicrobium sp. G57 TaxID=3418485 RepID=UPI003C1359D9